MKRTSLENTYVHICTYNEQQQKSTMLEAAQNKVCVIFTSIWRSVHLTSSAESSLIYSYFLRNPTCLSLFPDLNIYCGPVHKMCRRVEGTVHRTHPEAHHCSGTPIPRPIYPVVIKPGTSLYHKLVQWPITSMFQRIINSFICFRLTSRSQHKLTQLQMLTQQTFEIQQKVELL